MKHRFKRLLAVTLTAVSVINCIEISGYQTDALAVNLQTEAQSDGQTDTEEQLVHTENPGTDGTDTDTTEQDTDKSGTDVAENTEQDTGKPGNDVTENTEQDTGKPGNDVTENTEQDTDKSGEENAADDEENAEDKILPVAEEDSFPRTPEDLQKKPERKKYFVSSYADVEALQELSQTSSLEGYTFEFGKLDDKEFTWDLTAGYKKATEKDFEGFGSKAFPFKGTISEYIQSGATFKLGKPLFQYLGSGAQLTNFHMTLVNATSGIADYLIAGSSSPVTYTNILIGGTISNTNEENNDGAAGALYGTVINYGTTESYVLNVDGTNAGVSIDGTSGLQVNGCVAGGFVGQTQGNVTVRVSDASGLAKAVYSSKTDGIAGGIIGKLGAGGTFEVTSELTISNIVGRSASGAYSSNASAVGGLIGACENATVTSNKKVTKSNDIFIQGGTAGGFIGTAQDSAVTISHFTLDGMIKTSIGSTNRTCIQGGVLGSYTTTEQTENGDVTPLLDVSAIGIDKKQIAGGDDSDFTRGNVVKNGGIAGSITGDHVKIHDLSDADSDYPYMPSLGYDAYEAYAKYTDAGPGYTGGIAGEVTGKDITMYHLKLSFSRKDNCMLSGKRLGGLIGNVGQESKIRVTGIEIDTLFTNIYRPNNSNGIPEYAGGLFGYVAEGSIISLGARIALPEATDTTADASVMGEEKQDTADLPATGEVTQDTTETAALADGEENAEAVAENDTNWQGVINLTGIDYRNADNMYGGLRAAKAKGYIAGGQNEALIYLEDGADYRKNEKALNKDDIVWMEDYYNNKKDYTLNDIGNYGGLYSNIKDGDTYVIDFDKEYRKEVTGTVAYEDGTYTLKGTADALRLAIACNTFQAKDKGFALRFAADCFSQDDSVPATGQSLLKANYKVTADLDLAKAGIFSLVRNDGTDDEGEKYAFRGTFKGQKTDDGQTDKKVTIHMSIVSTQDHAGLFPYVNGATFNNLKLTGDIYYVTGFGGLAYHAQGNLTIDNVDQEMTMRTRGYVVNNNSINYYGGYVGYYELEDGTFVCKNSVIAPDISNIRCQQIVGGLVGYLKTTKKKTAEAERNIQISNVTIKSRLTTDSKFKQSTGDNVYQARMSGMIATLGKNNWINQAEWAGVEKNVENATYANVSLKDITVDGAVIDASSITNNPLYVRATGGFLGYQWDNAEVTVDGNTGIKVTGNSTIKSRGHVGGLFTTFSGKLDFNSYITLDSMTMQDVQGGQKFSALLVADGRYAIISLDADKYTIINGQQNSQDDTQDKSAKVTVTGYANFDEIVGVSCELKDNKVNDYHDIGLADDYYRQGGIVNIRMPAFKENMTDAANYKSYVNRISPQDNPYTRYYYNLFTNDYQPVTVKNNTATLDSPEDLMLWHLYLYTCSNSDKLKRFFEPYFHDENGNPSLMTVNGNDTWNLKENFDLKGYSFYPTRVTGGTYVGKNAVIKLYATDIAKGEKAHKNNCDKRTPQESGRQQYLMHAGLFVASNNYKVSGITFQGTIANLGADSGALCSKYTGGTVAIRDITLDGVRVDSYSDACGTGLLLSYVKGEKTDGCDLMLDGIQTKGYNNVYAAGALIGQVGSLTATNVRVTMRHMKVEYQKDNKVFQYASFICKYYYSSAVSDSGENTSRIVLYTFTQKDAKDNNVTYGKEMKARVNYYDQDRDEALQKKIGEAEDKYIPFIHHDSEDSRYIFVNPRNGNLDKGCGTYEDPYIISGSGQLKTLYLYLTGSGAYEDIFNLATDITDQADETGKTEDTDSTDEADGKKDNSWKVNIPGTDGRCNVDGTKVHTLAKYTDKEFPGRDVLRTAYYQIGKDIDLTDLMDMNDFALNSDFSGLGSEQYPFAGVIVGMKQKDGSYPSITLPKSTVVMDNYGLIQYMMGGVVKDINIEQAQTTDEKNEAIKVSDKGSAAGVAAIVLGGDNIIDNVGVNMTLQLTLDKDAQTAKTGAYAGDVRRGSVILRNLKADNFSNYQVCVNGNADTDIVKKSFAADGDLKYKRNSTVIGWVEDGYVLGYLSGTDKKADSPLLENAQLNITDKDIPLSYSFPIINGSYMDQGFTKDKITVTRDKNNGFVLTMHNGQQLEMASLALNSDAFSIYDSGKYDKNTCTVSNSNAYDFRAICRKANYSDVGCGYAKVSENDKPADFTDATTNDDGQKHYPYVYEKYVDFSAIDGKNYEATLKMKDNGDVNGAVISYLNWTFDDGNTYADKGPDVVTTYKLDWPKSNPTDYDLSIYGRSFRGFGSIYNKKYSAFKANFDGNNANVIIDMNRDWDSTIEHAGMFNGLQTVRKKTISNGEGGFVIQNLNIKNSHFKNSTRGAVGALTGYMKGRWTIKDVHLIRDTANQVASDTTPATVDVSGSGQVHAGGLVGIIDYYSTNANESTIQDITFDRSGVTGQEKKEAIISTATNVGGIVGYVEGSLNNVYTYYGTITFTDCNVSYAQIQTNGGNAGGFIGRVGYSYDNRTNYNEYVGGHSVGKVTISGTKGMDNTFPGTVEHSTIQVNRQNDSTYLSAGGLVGVYAGLNGDSGLTAEGIVMDTVTVNSDSNRYTNDIYYVSSGIGGILGGIWSNYLTVSNITVKNSKIGDRTEKNVNRLPAGGIVGAAYINNFKADDITISETKIESDTDSVAGIIGSNCVKSSFEAKGVTLKNSTLWSKQSAAGGVTGRYNVIGFSSNQAKPVISNITVANCKILAGCTEITDNSTTETQVTKNNAIASAGGVIGYADKNMYNLTISDVQVGTGTELAGYCTGGVIGYIKANTYITMTRSICIGCTLKESGNENVGDNDTTITYQKDSNPTILYGKWRNGGVVGSNESSVENKYSASIRIYNTKIAGYGTTSSSNTAMAAGLTGYEGNHTSTYDDVEVSECMFAVINKDTTLNAAAGCLWAYVNAGTHRIYRPVLTDNSVGYVKQESLTNMQSLEDFKKITSQDLGLVYNHDKSKVWNWQEIKAANKTTEVKPLNETTVAYYSYGVGNYVGTSAGGNVYILRPELKFTEKFSGNRPAIDVGNTSGNEEADYTKNHGYGYPYGYRQNVNIVYFEPEKAADKKKDAKDYLSDTIIAKTKNDSTGKRQEDEYLFSSLDTIAEAYQDNKNTGEDFLNDYKLNVTVGDKKVIQADKKNHSSYYDQEETNDSSKKKYIKELNGIQCLNADGVAAQDLLESMTDILTNTGGNGFLTIQAVSAKITKDGKIEVNPGKNSSIEVNSDKKSIQYRSFAADEPVDDGYTITLLIYEYGWKGADGNYRSEAIYIPVFVVERISVFNDLHILEGEQYSMTKAKDPSQSYQTEVTVAHDSTYTLFSEFAYSSARNKEAYKQFTVSKKLKLLQQDTNKKWNPAVIPKGLQFTLVEVSTGKPYYYTSTGTEKEIAFTAFKDDNANPYQYRIISCELNKKQKGYTYGGKEQGKTEEFGLEQFFIYVEPSSDAEILNSIFKWSVSTEDTQANYTNFMDESKEHSEIVITWMPGLDISFSNKEENADGTKIFKEKTAKVKEGSAINKDQKVTVTAAINIMANQQYWNMKNAADEKFIDSENNGKYLDVAIYLIDQKTGSYVTLPPGTYLRLNDEKDGKPTVNQSVSYAYQQWGLAFPLSILTANVQGWNQTVQTADTTYNNTFTLEMDFSAADLSEYVGNKYNIYMELRRTSDPEYPLEGTRLDDFSGQVDSYGNKELATTVEVSDIRNLGINTYKEQTNQYEIPFTTKLDFANMIYNEADITTCAKSDYLITYRLKKKVLYGVDADGNPQYKYVAVGSAANPNTISNSKMYANEKLKLALADTADSGVTTGGALVFRDAYGTDGDREPVYQMIKRFSADEIRKGTYGVDYLMQWDMKLTVDTKDIEISDLSNYMVEVTVLPIDPALTESEDTESITIDGNNWYIPKTDKGHGIGSSLKDYFIFTVGKLKTDL